MSKAGGPSPNADRITVGLTRRSADELDSLQQQTGLSKTDLVNRSIGMYKFLGDQIERGRELLVHDPDGTEWLVHVQ